MDNQKVKMDYEEAKKNFLEKTFKNNTKSINTIEAYENDLKVFEKFLNNELLKDNFLNLTISDAKYFIKTLRTEKSYLYIIDDDKNNIKYKDKYSNTTLWHIVTVLKNFYEYLKDNGQILNNPFTEIDHARNYKQIPTVLSYDEIEELMNSIKITKDSDIRDRALLELLYATGMRVSEIVNVEIKNIDFKRKCIYIIGKGDKERFVLFNETAKEWVLRYLNEVRKCKTGLLFVNNSKSTQNTSLTERGVEYILKKRVAATSIKKNVYPHLLRHTFATHLVKGGANLRVVQKLLGHDNLSTTQIYVTISLKEQEEAYEHHLRNSR